MGLGQPTFIARQDLILVCNGHQKSLATAEDASSKQWELGICCETSYGLVHRSVAVSNCYNRIEKCHLWCVMGQFASTDHLRSLLHIVRRWIAEGDGQDSVSPEFLASVEALFEETLGVVERLEKDEEELAQARAERTYQAEANDVQTLTLEAKIKQRILEHYQWILMRGGFDPNSYFLDVDKVYRDILKKGVPLPEVLRTLDVIVAEYRRGEVR